MKKFGTLLPKNGLAENPQALTPRRLGRQSAERERISEFDWMFLNKKLQSNLNCPVNVRHQTNIYGVFF
ncbi:hypothetical protein, partial [Peribacillus simplex]|uniref:hypothetical protein n=1 Tax=Peribacillus simplex TaxID=1478 RepID=UPI000BDC1114